jgi:hypothetical protein
VPFVSATWNSSGAGVWWFMLAVILSSRDREP